MRTTMAFYPLADRRGPCKHHRLMGPGRVAIFSILLSLASVAGAAGPLPHHPDAPFCPNIAISGQSPSNWSAETALSQLRRDPLIYLESLLKRWEQSGRDFNEMKIPEARSTIENVKAFSASALRFTMSRSRRQFLTAILSAARSVEQQGYTYAHVSALTHVFSMYFKPPTALPFYIDFQSLSFMGYEDAPTEVIALLERGDLVGLANYLEAKGLVYYRKGAVNPLFEVSTFDPLDEEDFNNVIGLPIVFRGLTASKVRADGITYRPHQFPRHDDSHNSRIFGFLTKKLANKDGSWDLVAMKRLNLFARSQNYPRPVETEAEARARVLILFECFHETLRILEWKTGLVEMIRACNSHAGYVFSEPARERVVGKYPKDTWIMGRWPLSRPKSKGLMILRSQGDKMVAEATRVESQRP